MGILIQFPPPSTRTLRGDPPCSQFASQDMRLAAAYRRDLDRAVTLLLEHVQSDAYDGVALILKPKSCAHKPALVVGGFYRHKLTEAADASMQLHLAIKLRANEQAAEPQTSSSCERPQSTSSPTQGAIEKEMQATLQQKWNDATARYYRCEELLRVAFSKQLRASPETTAILLSLTQLHIETVANCLWELVRQPGRATFQPKIETLNAIQLFRTVRAQVSAWMPLAGEETAYYAANLYALSEDIIVEGDALLVQAEEALMRVVGTESSRNVGT